MDLLASNSQVVPAEHNVLLERTVYEVDTLDLDEDCNVDSVVKPKNKTEETKDRQLLQVIYCKYEISSLLKSNGDNSEIVVIQLPGLVETQLVAINRRSILNESTTVLDKIKVADFNDMITLDIAKINI